MNTYINTLVDLAYYGYEATLMRCSGICNLLGPVFGSDEDHMHMTVVALAVVALEVMD